MKTLTLILLLACSLCGPAIVSGQQNKFDIGITGGPNTTWLVGNEIVEKYYKNVTHYALGLTAQYNFPKVFSVMTGLMYEQKGAASDVTVTDAKGQKIGMAKISKDLNYLIVPLEAKIFFGKKFGVFLGAGGYMA